MNLIWFDLILTEGIIEFPDLLSTLDQTVEVPELKMYRGPVALHEKQE